MSEPYSDQATVGAGNDVGVLRSSSLNASAIGAADAGLIGRQLPLVGSIEMGTTETPSSNVAGFSAWSKRIASLANRWRTEGLLHQRCCGDKLQHLSLTRVVEKYTSSEYKNG